MKKKVFPFYSSIILSCLFLACNSENDTFLIQKGKIGSLTTEHTIESLEELYKNDSLVEVEASTRFRFGSNKKYQLYEKGGKHLLTINPTTDSVPKIQNIRIFDDRYSTEAGISLKSTFKDISDNYKISKIESVLNNVVIYVNEIDAHFSIDKEELPADIRFDPYKKIEAVHIPDNAKIKYFMVGWD